MCLVAEEAGDKPIRSSGTFRICHDALQMSEDRIFSIRTSMHTLLISRQLHICSVLFLLFACAP